MNRCNQQCRQGRDCSCCNDLPITMEDNFPLWKMIGLTILYFLQAVGMITVAGIIGYVVATLL